MKLAIASDHAGYSLKEHLISYLRQQGHEVLDLGVDSDAVPSDYPDAALAVGEALQSGRAERGFLVCGSGIGACITANKLAGIYAAITHDTYSAAQGVQHDNMNVVCMGARVIGSALAEAIADAFLKATFSGEERHIRRFNKMKAIEARQI